MPKIMVVDDDVMSRNLLSRHLTGGGFEVVASESSNQAIALAESQTPDLALIDVIMPGLDGFQLCRALRQNPKTRQLPIIMITGTMRHASDKVTGLEAGADDFVMKPVDKNELIARANAILRRSTSSAASHSTANVTVWLGAKGGVGTTSTLVNVAAVIAGTGARVVIADWQPVPSCRMFLGMKPSQDSESVLTLDPEHISGAEVTKRLLKHPSGVALLPSSPETDCGLDTVPAETINALMEALTSVSDQLFIDLGTGLDENARRVIAASDRVIVVSEPDFIGEELADRTIKRLAKIEISGPRVACVLVNRAGGAMHRVRREVPAVDDIAARLGTTVLGLVTASPDAFLKSSVEGEIFVQAYPVHEATRVFQDLAQTIVESRKRAQ